jgi:uronate dehydrogenase
MKKILVTGAAGHLGQGLILPFKNHYQLRLNDIVPLKSDTHEVMIGDVADLDLCRQLVKGMDGLIVAHLVKRNKQAIEEPPAFMDAMVKGTANLLHAANEEGIKKAVIISSTGVVRGHREKFYEHGRRPLTGPIYGTAKSCQEVIGEYFAINHHMQVAALRIGWVIDAETMTDKYHRGRLEDFNIHLTERRDIGRAARLALEKEWEGFDSFYVVGGTGADKEYDTAYTREILGWEPEYTFKELKH